MTTTGDDIIHDGTDGHGEASAGSRSSLGRTDTDPADAETDSGSICGNPPVSSETGGSAAAAVSADQEPSGTPEEAVASETVPAGGEPADELTRVTAERDEYLDLARRTQAEFENFRKRAARERGELRARAIADVIRDLLPVVDNIDRALAAAENGDDESDEALLQGIQMVHTELHGFLDRLGLQAIEADGERFDPSLHEAIASVAVDGIEAGVIHEVHQTGFRLDEIVVRPARVVVTA